MKYADGTDEFLARYHDAMPENFFERSVAEQRRLYLSLSDVFPYQLPASVTITDHEIGTAEGSLPFRLYRPTEPVGSGLLVYFHGGGFVVGSPDSHNTLAAELAANTGLVTVAPDFRQAPEHPFPATPEDCYAFLRALAEHPEAVGGGVRTDGPVLCGDSSGGNLGVCVALMCRDRGGVRPKGQGLIGPVLDFARWFDGGEDDFAPEMQYYTRSYCPDRDLVTHPYVSPLVSARFHDLPPAYIMSTEFDELREDSVAYADHLRRAGIPVQLVVEPGLVHAPVRGRSIIPQVADAWKRFCAAVGAMATA
ncbi:alpha/beta hydrolase [Solihabitans fulvus]|uniref:Alpha/beta hydrolase n=1 Tax=Solihabitans fulvus TaxID=1892852 RepID=A0A5B2WY60_9PSEU|nr:alpha/beta hydrolase [Solihabitans fulvus]KAA2255446.1 alpha/beta hydrolase [Solihabitans fulvus]